MTRKADLSKHVNRENLTKLATYLEALPDDYSHFDMKRYHTVSYPDDAPLNCGTVACAVGHGPSAGIVPEADESWRDYGFRAFFNWRPDQEYVPLAFILWTLLFSDDWEGYDNTHQGAAMRIRWVLAQKHLSRLSSTAKDVVTALELGNEAAIDEFIKEYSRA